MPSLSTWVVKLGGSLLELGAIPEWLRAIEQASDHARLIIVPGGGPFADAIRAAQRSAGFDDATAHRMALLAMRQMGELVCDLGGGRFRLMTTVDRVGDDDKVVVCAPSPDRLTVLPEDWRVTSDSIALRLAHQSLARGLVLVKAVPPPAPFAVAAELVSRGYIDEHFADYLRDIELPVYALGRDQVFDFRRLIQTAARDPQR